MEHQLKMSQFSSRAAIFHLIIVFGLIYGAGSYEKNHIDEPEVVFHLGTKTPYRVVANKNDTVIEYPDCYPVKIFGIVRHGTRTPGINVINRVKQMISTVKSRIGTQDVISFLKGLVWESQVIKNWSAFLRSDTEKLLTAEGGREMELLAQRFQNRFPDLMPKIFSNSSYIFKYTDTQRTKESARHFSIGLFGEEASGNVWFERPLKQDPILRFYRLCDRWRKEVKKNPKTKIELNKYKKTFEALEMLKKVSSRISLNYTLSFDTLHLIFTACAFETAWYPGSNSLWCSPFEKNDIEVMEYFEELKYYWRDGYGFDINHKQACPLLQKAMNFLLEKSGPKAIFYFTHSGTLLKFLSHIGLYKDGFKLTHDTDQQLRQARNWKASQINSFGNNFVFVLFRCKDGDKLLTLHQERPVILNGCPDEDLCSLSTVRQVLPLPIDHHCDFSRICSL